MSQHCFLIQQHGLSITSINKSPTGSSIIFRNMKEPGVVAQAFIPSTPETEARVLGQARLEGHSISKKGKEYK